MYIWDIDSLKNDIKLKKLSELDKFIYMFINLILITYIPILFDNETIETSSFFINFVEILLISILEVIGCLIAFFLMVDEMVMIF